MLFSCLELRNNIMFLILLISKASAGSLQYWCESPVCVTRIMIYDKS